MVLMTVLTSKLFSFQSVRIRAMTVYWTFHLASHSFCIDDAAKRDNMFSILGFTN